MELPMLPNPMKPTPFDMERDPPIKVERETVVAMVATLLDNIFSPSIVSSLLVQAVELTDDAFTFALLLLGRCVAVG
jgi:hypothetical protein